LTFGRRRGHFGDDAMKRTGESVVSPRLPYQLGIIVCTRTNHNTVTCATLGDIKITFLLFCANLLHFPTIIHRITSYPAGFVQLTISKFLLCT
jgi:hypothetical protein